MLARAKSEFLVLKEWPLTRHGSALAGRSSYAECEVRDPRTRQTSPVVRHANRAAPSTGGNVDERRGLIIAERECHLSAGGPSGCCWAEVTDRECL
jgi:hypothetical protein